MSGKWSKERDWEWYNSRPWIRGCNFMPSDCANRIDMWQEYRFEEHFATAECFAKGLDSNLLGVK